MTRANHGATYRAVLAALPDPWSLTSDHGYWVNAERPDGLQLVLYNIGGRRGFARAAPPGIPGVLGSFKVWGLLRHDEKEPATSFDLRRNPEEIARQVQRSAIAPASQLIAEAMRRRAARLAQRDRAQAAVLKIAAAFGLEPRGEILEGREAVLWPDLGDHARMRIRFSPSGFAELSISGMSPELAVKICELIKLADSDGHNGGPA